MDAGSIRRATLARLHRAWRSGARDPARPNAAPSAWHSPIVAVVGTGLGYLWVGYLALVMLVADLCAGRTKT